MPMYRKFDDLGRVVVPKEIRDHLGLTNKSLVTMYYDPKSRTITISPCLEACVYCGKHENVKRIIVCEECHRKNETRMG